jgi:aspartate aminotransferase
MPQISDRGVAMPPSPIRKLVPFADAAKLKGTKVFHLNIGQPDIETPAAVLDAVRNSDFKVLDYSHSAGNLSYRQKLCGYYKTFNIDINPDEIIVTAGGSEAILFAIMSCLDADEEIIIPEPFYANYNGYAIAAGAKVIPVSSSIESGFALPPIEEFEKHITNKTRAILICNPSNPTGYLYTDAELNILKDICVKHDLFLFSDEAYREFCYTDAPYKSALTLDGMQERVVVIDTISKRYSACGARIGSFITKNKDLYNVAMKFAQARLSPPSFGQIAGEAATLLPTNYFQSVKAEYLLRRDTLVNRLNQMEGVFCPMPGGAFYAMAKLPIDDSDKFCQWLLESFSFNGNTIMMAPATGFYATPGKGKQEVRMAYVLNVQAINDAMDCLQQALIQYPGKL